MNSKKESSYNTVLKDFLRLIKYDIKDEINLLSYTTDFEIGLIDACTVVFGEKIRSVGCLFHFGQSIIRNFQASGMLKGEYRDYTNELYKKLIILPWLYENNDTIVNDTFNEFISKNKDKEYKKLLYNYFD
jgi:hypothetical protein